MHITNVAQIALRNHESSLLRSYYVSAYDQCHTASSSVHFRHATNLAPSVLRRVQAPQE